MEHPTIRGPFGLPAVVLYGDAAAARVDRTRVPVFGKADRSTF
jgi:hypothetical protein